MCRAVQLARLFLLGLLAATALAEPAPAAAADTPAAAPEIECAGGPCAMFFWGKGDGSGTIYISDPMGPREPCRVPPSCARTLTYPNDEGVATMRAVPDAGFVFAGWENCPDTQLDGSCAVSIQDFINTEYLCAIFRRSGTPNPEPGCPPRAHEPPPPPPNDTVAPNTRLLSGPTGSTRSRRAIFRFGATESATFICKLDGRPWLPCRSPRTYTRVRTGWHTFRVRAIDRAGNVDSTPAVRRWRVRA